MKDYITSTQNTDFTSTWKPPTKIELEADMKYHLLEYAKRGWFMRWNSDHLKRAVKVAEQYLALEQGIITLPKNT